MERKRSGSAPVGAAGLKVLITAASVAATVGGWALFTAEGLETTAPALPPATEADLPAPLPTLAPLVDLGPVPSVQAIGGGSATASGSVRGSELRVVTAPAPIARTRSSQ